MLVSRWEHEHEHELVAWERLRHVDAQWQWVRSVSVLLVASYVQPLHLPVPVPVRVRRLLVRQTVYEHWTELDWPISMRLLLRCLASHHMVYYYCCYHYYHLFEHVHVHVHVQLNAWK